MSLLDGLRMRVTALLRRSELDDDLAEELRFHLEMEMTKLEAEGLAREEAKREAMKRFGGLYRFEQAARDERGTRWLEEAWQDVTYGARVLRRNRGMAVLLIGTLALGIAATTAVFSIVNTVLLNPLPYPESDRLVIMREIERNNRPNWASHPNFVDFREQATHNFEAITSAEWPNYVTVLGAAEPVRVLAMGVARDYFETTRVPPLIGRVLLSEENRVAGAASVVVSEGFWQTYLGGNTNLASLSLNLNGEQYQVVGVMPHTFRFMGEVALWFPYERNPNQNRRSHAYRIIGRMKPDATIEQARAEMTSVAKLLLDEYGEGTRAIDVNVTSAHEHTVGGTRRSLLLLLGAAGLLLLVACTNIASTLLARGMAREQEIAVRSSMGAGRMRLVRQLFTESLLVAVGGVLLGVGLALLAVKAFGAIGAGRVPRMAEVSLSPGVLSFSVVVSFLAAVLFGLVPAVRLADRDGTAHLRFGTRGATSGGKQALWRGLVGAEIAMATMLLIGAGLLVRSLWTILDADIGYRTENVLAVNLSLPPAKYGDKDGIRLFYDQLLPELRSIPSVESVGMVNFLPLQYGSWTAGTNAYDAAAEDNRGTNTTAGWRVVNADYFRALDIALVRGRGFEPSDVEGAPAVAVVNASLAGRLWPDEDPVGKRVKNGFDQRDEWFTVIGVVEQARSWEIPDQPELFVHYLQRPEDIAAASILLATTSAPTRFTETVRDRLHTLDPDVPVDFVTIDHMVSTSVAGPRFTMLVLLAFAAAALILAVIGVYGVVSYSVARRRREIGIRLALGAAPRSVRRLIQRGALTVAVIAVLAGALGAFALSGVMRAMLFEVQPTDPLTFGIAIVVLLAAAAAASYVPARRSTVVDPMITMRAE